MKTHISDHSDFDDRLDAMLGKTPVKASADFTAKTLARLHAATEVNDELIDDLLSRRPARASSDFTARAVRAATRQRSIIAFMRPALAAAASVAICMTGLWSLDSSSYETETPALASENDDMTEIMTLAAALNEAAPLLDAKATDTLASLINIKE